MTSTKDLLITIDTLQIALDESLKLQSHYAKLLNTYDGGQRLQFHTIASWLTRLNALRGV